MPCSRTERFEKSLMNASELLVRCLEAEGVEFIFGISGEENIDVIDALLGSEIRLSRRGTSRETKSE